MIKPFTAANYPITYSKIVSLEKDKEIIVRINISPLTYRYFSDVEVGVWYNQLVYRNFPEVVRNEVRVILNSLKSELCKPPMGTVKYNMSDGVLEEDSISSLLKEGDVAYA